ncbi:MAG: histidine phosphatase family protein [Spirochaetota bacterium]
MNIFIIRHSQSEANLQNLLGGQGDYALSEQGAKDARQVAEEFCEKLGYPIHRLISSPLRRAKETAAVFAQVLGIRQIEEEALLTEQGMGVYTGMSYDDLATAPGYVHARNERWDWQPQGGGESYRQVAERVSRFFGKLYAETVPPRQAARDSLQPKSGGPNMLIVSHAVCMRLIYGYLCDMFPRYLEPIPYNGEIWQVQNPEPHPQNQIIRHHFGGSREAKA